MRYYGFGNYYLSSLQQGLQAHHVGTEMGNIYLSHTEIPPVNNYALNKGACEIYADWAKNHKTIVLLNGGNSKDLAELYEFFNNGLLQEVNPYPFAKFNEDEQSLNCALTSVGIVLPPEIYDTAAEDRASRTGKYQERGSEMKRIGRPKLNAWQEELIERLNKYGLAK